MTTNLKPGNEHSSFRDKKWMEDVTRRLKNLGGSSGTNTGDVTLAGSPNYITIVGQVITRALINLTSHVTGRLPFANIAQIATSSLIYRKTAGTGDLEVNTLATLKTDLGLTGTNSGDQTITLTSDVTGTGTGSFATTIANNAVSLAKMADIATSSLIYRKTAGTGDPEVNTLATLKADLGLTGTNSGDVTLAGAPTYLTLAGQVITRTLINLTSHITGTLPVANGGTGLTDATIAFGTWTPTLTNTTNISASTAYLSTYFRLGSIGIAFGKVDIDAIAAGDTRLGVSFPIASNIANTPECAGTFTNDTSNTSGAIYGDATNNRALFRYQATGTANTGFFFIFGFRII